MSTGGILLPAVRCLANDLLWELDAEGQFKVTPPKLTASGMLHQLITFPDPGRDNRMAGWLRRGG